MFPKGVIFVKKILALILSIIIFIVSFGSSAICADEIEVWQYGDVNKDSFVNNKDLGLLMQYLNNWDVTIYMDVADVNVDGSVNNKDYGLLMQYLNNWDVVLGKQPGQNPDNLMNDGINPEDYRGRTIKFISTIDPKYDESGPVVENFEKEYGITVEIIPSGIDEYAQKCVGLIAVGASPDVACSNGDFPACMGYLQSLDAAKLNYKEEIWNQNTFKLTTFGGSPYLCDTLGNIFTETDIVVYSKSMLNKANAYTPEDYDRAGKWTWDAFFEIGKACQKVTGKPGCAINSYECYFHAAGGSVYKIENGKVVNGIDSNSAAIMEKYALARKDNILMTGKSVASALMEGDIGIATFSSSALKKTGEFRNANWLDLGFYYLPYYDEDAVVIGERPVTGFLRGWGICYGANEPVAAGLFLREYLDVNNYDVRGTFITPEAETLFYHNSILVLDYDNYNPYFTYQDLNTFVTGVEANEKIYYPMYRDPTQVVDSMPDVRENIDKGVKNSNKYIDQFTGLR